MGCIGRICGTLLTLGVDRAELRGKTATRPEGPFSDYFTIFTSTEFTFVYSPSQQTHYDPSGKTLVLSYTGYPNIIQAVKAVSTIVISIDGSGADIF